MANGDTEKTSSSGYCGRFFAYFTITFAFLTAASLLAIGITQFINGPKNLIINIYIVAIGGLILFMEMVSLSTSCVKKTEESGCCLKTVRWADNWKRGVFYIVLSIACFAKFLSVLYITSGCLTAASGVFYCMKTCRDTPKKTKKEDKKQLTANMA
ncbi:uncharacterized protein LOC117100313 [Anneissia japonica]|uniref:uncharacterized protein LOC117100313 n=1 Tax=Anneissia japonica TaxID=1529436 RepID=UPI001425B7E4|nr:uncharacterized protein LOC117100313 [Anneissia japonica]